MKIGDIFMMIAVVLIILSISVFFVSCVLCVWDLITSKILGKIFVSCLLTFIFGGIVGGVSSEILQR